MRSRVLMATALLLLASGCGDNDGDQGRSGDKASKAEAHRGDGAPCTFVSDATLEMVDTTLGRESLQTTRSPVRLLKDNEHMVGCDLMTDTLSVGVQVAEVGRSIETYFDYAPDSARPFPGLGEEAFAGDNSYAGRRVVARSGDQVVLVDSTAAVNSPEEAADVDELLTVIAEEVLVGLGERQLEAVDLPEACPAIDSALIRDETGTVVAARGVVSPGGSVICAYSSRDRFLNASVVKASTDSVAMYRGMTETEPIDVDGAPAYFDEDDEVFLILAEDCVVTAQSSPMGWALVDPRTTEEQHDAVLALATHMRDEIGCPN